MKKQNYVELYVCPEIRVLIDNKVQELTGVNKRLYKNKLLFILSRLHCHQIYYTDDFIKNGTKLRISFDQKLRMIQPNDEKTSLVWYLSTKCSKITNMIKTLIQWGIIIKKHDHVVRKSARTYTFTNQFINSPAALEKFYIDKDGAFVKKILQAQFDREQQPIIKKVLNIYRNNISISEAGFRYIRLLYGQHPVVNDIIYAHQNNCFNDNREALLEATKKIRISTQHLMLWKFFVKEYYTSVSPQTGRVNHNLTNLERKYRRFILIDGMPLLETDIVNCQPALASGLINQQLRNMYGEQFVAPDMIEYERNCREGRFYEVLANKAGISFDTPKKREDFKKGHFYPEVFYCKNNNWNTPTQIAFRDLFPNANAAIRELKKKHHNQFSINLQQLESDIIIQSVFTQLTDEGYKVLPLHDAIYTNHEFVKQYAQNLIRRAIREKHGIEISFKGEARVVKISDFRKAEIEMKERTIDHGAVPVLSIKCNDGLLMQSVS